MKMPRPSARVDVAVVNGEICGFEIKSDVDGLSRLPRQIRAFSAIFDRVSIVTTEKHIESASRLIPEWWGIITPSSSEEFSITRGGLNNPSRDTVALLHVLSRSELRAVLEASDILKGNRSKRQAELIAIAADINEERLLHDVRMVLKRRRPNYSSSSHSRAGPPAKVVCRVM